MDRNNSNSDNDNKTQKQLSSNYNIFLKEVIKLLDLSKVFNKLEKNTKINTIIIKKKIATDSTEF